MIKIETFFAAGNTRKSSKLTKRKLNAALLQKVKLSLFDIAKLKTEQNHKAAYLIPYNFRIVSNLAAFQNFSFALLVQFNIESKLFRFD